ncbi:acyl-CoA dehydrogenase family protein [Streptomonospora litoralis]|uniref:Acyl-CoA dehydrogenase, middle domain n=1 Tax=Streptomonospora litoralis TaxID=2498135 RepID=A0A4P6Q7B7_9ACTN|nr:acyl-CoA dehydrogenase [Streptomonospora litoralis]QBI56593.1 Acyl-CoA dehydrogenase, middle domain [Streptomonospora litoralis]
MNHADHLGTAVTAPQESPAPAAPADEPNHAAEHRLEVAAALVREVGEGRLDLPLPGSGDTWRRWAALRDLARRDLSLARLAEGHCDAVAILAELGGPAPEPHTVWGVWAAHPPGPDLDAQPDSGGEWRLSGTKRFCSGARVCTHGLVSARIGDDQRRLFAVATATAQAERGSWAAAGMTASDTLTLTFDDVAATPVGPAGAYTARPGFHHGGIGVAACWYGGALAIAAPLAERVAADRADAHARAYFGGLDRDLHAAEAVLIAAAREVDADPGDRLGGARLRAMRARAVVAETCANVLRGTREALGAGPLAADISYARASEDLAAYLHQHHGDRDLAELGTSAAPHTPHVEDGHGPS